MRRPTSTPPELPGYTFVKVLGSGGFSDVFLYEQQLPKRRVAVKVLLTEELSGANRAAFVAEANLMAQLSTHPYIVTIYQADVASDDRPYFVMEYCSGPSLAERYKQETFPVADALRTGVRLSSAVATAHSAGILHRDIKPANVLTNDYGWPALTDFGISSAVEEDVLPLHTGTLADALSSDTGTNGTGASIGMSVPWSPPEMFEDDPVPDVRSDVFSLAATIYTILAGHTPFEVRGHSNGTLDLIGRIERGAITPMPRDDLPRSLVAVLQKGMASDRADRFATAVDFARALQRVELELGYAPTTIDVPNLLVEAPSRDGAADDADETQVRGVATIQAQPVILPPLMGAKGSSSPLVEAPPAPPSADETQVRGAQRIEAQPVARQPTAPAGVADVTPEETVVRRRVQAQPGEAETAPPPAAALEPKKKTSRTTKVIVWVVSAVAVVIAAAVVLGFVVFGTPSATTATPKPSATGGESAIVETTPVPVQSAGPVLSDSTVTFSVVNPKPNTGDSFLWRISNRGDSEPRHNSSNGSISVQDYATGTTLCIQAFVVRKGKESAPLEMCYPQ
ncbi:MAG: serine/threonine protein kinase [Microbacteriaceae bacterium]|nr:serine/threonine protein kinase [Microbacteriaceae bacterium]